ncbi:AAA family ATPase [Pseudomonas citronellolis]|uniref:AAA family ATPase n=1 Tax=Pseudomonas citronellolis TaxID=53408 RepID=UPI0021C0ED0C|nr:AAA family ATPase [Pseudomonas citronellolis]UXJ54960.1 AAA family ATPase [Pseudomonas citronellolis]
MSGTIRKIEYIKNLAIFRDFQWKSSVRDEGNNIAEFKKINIFYGRNYSGKTTLSRIFRAMETGNLSDKYSNPDFQINFEDYPQATSRNLRSHGQTIRVFNEDFVRENLKFIIDNEQEINSFAILGEDNAKTEEEIKEKESALGSEEENQGALGELKNSKEKLQGIQLRLKSHEDLLEEKLKDKANSPKTGIKHNKSFGEANYNISKIKQDIATVTSKNYKTITDSEALELRSVLKEEPKGRIEPQTAPKLNYQEISNKAKELVEKNISVSETLKELLSDAALESWIRKGKELHEGKRSNCAFCGNEIPHNLWEKLDKHFNKESEELHTEIDNLISRINSEKTKTQEPFKISYSDFYSSFHKELENLQDKLTAELKIYQGNLTSLCLQLENRKKAIHTPLNFETTEPNEKELNKIFDDYKAIQEKSNLFTENLSEKQAEARDSLRLNEVFIFTNDIKYAQELDAIKNIKDEEKLALQEKLKHQQEANEIQEIIKELKSKLKDESKGAERVNEYLNNFFGHEWLSLEAIENSTQNDSSSFRFEVRRNNEKAYHLSEGECSLIAFCYFVAKLEDIETRGSQPIIWIDDPICSLDANHIFFVYSLINAKILRKEKYLEGVEEKERDSFKQLFISTHNLDFLKYIKRLPGALNKKLSQYFIINRISSGSQINLMPGYLKEYVTEFNFLFHQIHKCANAQIENDENHDCYYNFGNNARKFLEAFLYY